MMKNKSKKQLDEGSTQSNASRYDPHSFYTTFISAVIVYLVEHGRSCLRVFAKWGFEEVCDTVTNDLAIV